jgi:aspartate/methionine/tyrosine aminotransferase
MAAALDDDEHVDAQRRIYGERRTVLQPALESAGWCIDHSEGGLYLWVTHPLHDSWSAVEHLAKAGVLVAPGDFYGAAGRRHVRVAMTAPTERIRAAAHRLETTT